MMLDLNTGTVAEGAPDVPILRTKMRKSGLSTFHENQ